jgi:predicted thioredoxin/glutaredoxin
MKLTLLTNKNCGPCFVLKNKLKNKELEVETLCFSDPDTHEFFKKHNIKSVPRLVIEDGENVTVVDGVDDIFAEIEKSVK